MFVLLELLVGLSLLPAAPLHWAYAGRLKLLLQLLTTAGGIGEMQTLAGLPPTGRWN